jgi:hypothetical protein
MKGNKKILALALLLLLVVASFGTYAIYKSSATSSTTVGTAKWVVKVNTQDIVTSDTFTVRAADINWSGVTHSKVSGKIAPGDSGTVTVLLDATGSEVDVDYVVTLGTVTSTGTGTNNNFSVAPTTPGDLNGTIEYNASSMQKSITFDVVWNWADDTTSNPVDVDWNDATITIPITVTAQQHVTS